MGRDLCEVEARILHFLFLRFNNRVMGVGYEKKPYQLPIECVILIIGAIASVWMVLSLSLKFYRDKLLRSVDFTLFLLAACDAITCAIKSYAKYAMIGLDTDEVRALQAKLGWIYQVANGTMTASFLWQPVLTVLILRRIQGKSLNLYVVHLIVWSISLTRCLAGVFGGNVGIEDVYSLLVLHISFIIVSVSLVRIHRLVKLKKCRLFTRIRLFPFVFLLCVAPRMIYAYCGFMGYDSKTLDCSTIWLFYAYAFMNCLVYGVSLSCLTFSRSKVRRQSSDTIDPSKVSFDSSDVIGSGGSGVIYKGMYRGCSVAVKHIRFLDLSEECHKNFTQEALMLSRVIHPNIVYFMGAFLDGTDGYIVVEYCNQGSLRCILDTMPRDVLPINWNWRCKIAIGIARGLLYLHQTTCPTIIHRDLKSPNVLVNDYCTAKVADFGTARLLSTCQETSHMIGTSRWAAPELLQCQTMLYSTAMDIYSFGMILYELVTFEIPFHHLEFNYQVLEAVDEGKRPTLPSYCLAEWRELIFACWSDSPIDRPTAAHVLHTLEAYFIS